MILELAEAVRSVDLRWEDEDAGHIRSRSTRSAPPGAVDLEPEWTLQAAADPARVVRQVASRDGVAYLRLVGYSPSAGCVLTVIIDRHDSSGVTAGKTRGADLRRYLEGRDPADG